MFQICWRLLTHKASVLAYWYSVPPIYGRCFVLCGIGILLAVPWLPSFVHTGALLELCAVGIGSVLIGILTFGRGKFVLDKEARQVKRCWSLASWQISEEVAPLDLYNEVAVVSKGSRRHPGFHLMLTGLTSEFLLGKFHSETEAKRIAEDIGSFLGKAVVCSDPILPKLEAEPPGEKEGGKQENDVSPPKL